MNPKAKSQTTSFSSHVQEIRNRAREHVKKGAVTPSYPLDSDVSVNILNEALATEIVCYLRYQFHYFNADGILSESVKAEFKEHAQEERGHADRIAVRI